VQVVRTRNSASIYRPTCIANLANAALWVAYGVAVHDPFIWVPNGVGGILSVFLISLTVIYTSSSPASSTAGAQAAPLNGQ
jgi:solute carrier family 50 protein (sugar transporter)